MGKMCHFDMIDNKRLIITVDFQSPQFVLWEYLRLTMKEPKDSLAASKVLLEEMGLHNV